MSGYTSPAMRRYLKRVTALMIAYVVLLVTAVTLFRGEAELGLAAWPLALLPALPVIGVVWAVMRLLVEEPDEYLRMLMVRQALIATGFSLAVTTVWEFLQNFELVPAGNGGFGAAFFWFIGLGLGAAYNKLVAGKGAGSR